MPLILCVEDEAEIREDIADELKDAGHEVIEAANGAEGLQKIVSERPDLVVSDITMPEMDGLAFLKVLREEHPDFVDLPFIFLSALADRGDRMRGIELGVDDYLTKPIDFDVLLATVQARLTRMEGLRKQKEAEFVRLYQSLTVQKSEEESATRPQKTDAEGSEETERTFEKEEINGTVFFVIALDDVREMLNDRWHRYADMVDQIATRTIRRRLKDKGLFRRRVAGEYLVAFPQLKEAQAMKYCHLLHEEIVQHFLGASAA